MRIMKLNTFFIFLLSLNLSANIHAQHVKISLDLKEVSMKEFFRSVKQKTGISFLYNSTLLENNEKISVQVKEEYLDKILTDILEKQGLTFTYQNNAVVIKKREILFPSTEEKRFITGKITDKNKVPLPGVSVYFKGINIGTVSNVNGDYKILMTDSTSVLMFSFIGMKTEYRKYKGQDTINVIMEEDLTALDEVIVTTGYQSLPRKDMVGSFTTIKAADVLTPAYTTIDEMLQGQVPGMLVMNTSARAGASPKVQIRGLATYNNFNPIWVVDGVIQPEPISITSNDAWSQNLKEILGNQVSWLNPQDIETITVLKDASATAIYGSMAANGVIVVTTKKEKIGQERISINYSGSFSIGTAPNYRLYNLMNSQERVKFSDEAYNGAAAYAKIPYFDTNVYEGLRRSFADGQINEQNYIAQRRYLEEINTDWFDLLCRMPIAHNHSLGLSGASQKVSYRFSIGYNKNQGQEIGNDSERLSGSMSLGANLWKNVNVDFRMTGSVMKNTSFAGNVAPFNYAVTTSRAIPVFNEDGSYAYYQKENTYSNTQDFIESLNYNIINERENGESEVKNTQLSASVNLQWNILPTVGYRLSGGMTKVQNSSDSWTGEQTYEIANSYRGYNYGEASPENNYGNYAQLAHGGIYHSSENTSQGYNLSNQLTFSKTFAEKHRLNVMLGTEIRSTTRNGLTSVAYGYIPERGEIIVTPTYPTAIEGSAGGSGFGILENIYRNGWTKTKQTDNFFSIYGTVAYSFNNCWVLNANVRNDASNRFGQDINRRIDPTYSFGVKWNVTNESFVQNHMNWLSNLNLSATYGIQGNAQTNISPDLIVNSAIGVSPIFNDYAVSISKIPNKNLSWEHTYSWNFGVDLGLFNMFSAGFNYYTRRSKAILQTEIPHEYGVTTIQKNGALIWNTGWEVSVSFSPIHTQEWALALSFNCSQNKNKTDKPQNTSYLTYNTYLNGNSSASIRKNYPIGAFWAWSFKELNPETGAPVFNKIDQVTEEQMKEDPTCAMVYAGQQDPDFTGGLNLTLRYKQLTLGTGFMLLLGGKNRLPSPYANFSNGKVPDGTVNLSRDLTKRWQKKGDEAHTSIPGLSSSQDYYTKIPGISGNIYTLDMWANSDALLVSRSFLRCRNLNLSWNVNEKICKYIGVDRLALSATVNNLFVIASSKWNGFDPELKTSRYPKTYSLGINIGF